MRNRFNPVSTAIAVATASVLVAIGGCAMGTRNNDDNAALSHEPNRNPESMVQGAPQSSLDQSAMTTPTTVSPAPEMTSTVAPSTGIQPAQQTEVIAQGDTSATPNATPMTPAAPAATTYTPAPAYNTTTNSSTTSTVSTTPADTSMSSTSNSNNSSNYSSTSNEQPLPPRADRN